jgi:hypothetical protein
MKTIPLTVLAMMTQYIVLVVIPEDGNFFPISSLKPIPALESVTAFKRILPSEGTLITANEMESAPFWNFSGGTRQKISRLF